MFIVIEGIDGAGCETQGKNLLKMIDKDRSRPVPTSTTTSTTTSTSIPTSKPTLIKYPDYQRNVGKIIKEFLYQNKDLTAEQQFLLYTMQFIMDSQMIKDRRKNGILIADRYFTTTLCYQTLEGINLKMALDYAKNFKIEVPDLVFYLDVNPDTAIKRKFGEQKEKNRREKDFDFIRKTYKQYQYLVENQVWTKWVKIDGSKKIDEVTKEIFVKIKEYDRKNFNHYQT